MAASPKLVLLLATWLVLLVSLFLVLVLGADSLTQFDAVGTQFIASIDGIATSFAGLGETIINSIASYVTFTVGVFGSFAAELGTGFLNIVNFLESSVAGLITQVLNAAGNSIDTVGRAIITAGSTVAGAFLSIANFIGSVQSSLSQLMIDSALWLGTFMVQLVSAGIVSLINLITTGIQALEDYVNEFVVEPIQQVIDFLSNLDFGGIGNLIPGL